MAMNLQAPDIRELKPRITVFGVGGAGGNAVNNMIEAGLDGVDFVVANTDAQALALSRASRIIQMGLQVTEGLGAGSQPEVGRAAAEEVIDEIRDHLAGAHMVFITAGMGGGTGTGAAPAIARVARDMGILTVGVVTKPFQFEGHRRMRMAEAGIGELNEAVDTLIVIPNQNLFRVANETTGFADAFGMADQVLYSGVACITDLMVRPGLINLDFADVRAVMRGMGKAMMGTGEAAGDKRALSAAQAAINNPLLDDVSMKGARGLLISITGGRDMKLYEVDEAATRIREEVDSEANIIVGATFDESLEGIVRVSVVATGIDKPVTTQAEMDETEARIAQVAERLKAEARLRSTGAPARQAPPAPAAPEPVMERLPPSIETQRPARRCQPGHPHRAGPAAPGDGGPGARAGHARRCSRASGRQLHPADAGTRRGAPDAHAADRGSAGSGAEPDRRQPRRPGRAAAAELGRSEAHVADAASRLGRLRPQGRGDARAAAAGAAGAAAARGSAGAERGACRVYAPPGCAGRAAGAGSARPARPGRAESEQRGGPARDSGLPAPPGELRRRSRRYRIATCSGAGHRAGAFRC